MDGAARRKARKLNEENQFESQEYLRRRLRLIKEIDDDSCLRSRAFHQYRHRGDQPNVRDHDPRDDGNTLGDVPS